MIEARLIGPHGNVVARHSLETGRPLPPIIAHRPLRQKDQIASLIETGVALPSLEAIRIDHYELLGVEVDVTGTWAHYAKVMP